MDERIDTASRLISASASTVYDALTHPDAWLKWLPPGDMTGEITRFDLREGGHYRMSLRYHRDADGNAKSTDDTDVIQGRFVELVPDERVVQAVTFDSDDPAYAGEMQMTWRLTTESTGTRITISATNVPTGISPEDHAAGLQSSLENLEKYLDQ